MSGRKLLDPTTDVRVCECVYVCVCVYRYTVYLCVCIYICVCVCFADGYVPCKSVLFVTLEAKRASHFRPPPQKKTSFAEVRR